MSTEIITALLSAAPISVDKAIAAVQAPGCGAVVSFSGVVRDHDGGKDVHRLGYSAHPSAERVMADVVAAVVAEYAADRAKDGHSSADQDNDQVSAGPKNAEHKNSDQADIRIWAAHRVGPLEVGDAALVCAVATPHRQLAFSLCDALVDRIKEEVPIWKEQFFADGTVEWVGAGQGSDRR
ncbi:molybdenum cofactor biosynthesis protein MoaE [Arthrobacter sp. H14-L1]|uniref:molybdenum cofactor biosynthesis protein MoaE n=1 Tax=Arthrobacter sp. H14-L1 TaxID=2996697 RepID=UPI00226DD18E|nr:molybdenum cofactor biosynthesis protein MoaE [Arthrobacter sp. H14-L1]MCY0904713.1 molybdenum cofactor biosynthesis protein MoaE [Arthrobacter sp. H14-L1]